MTVDLKFEKKSYCKLIARRHKLQQIVNVELKSSAWEYRSQQIVKNKAQIVSMEVQIAANGRLGKANHSKQSSCKHKPQQIVSNKALIVSMEEQIAAKCQHGNTSHSKSSTQKRKTSQPVTIEAQVITNFQHLSINNFLFFYKFLIFLHFFY